MDRGLAEKSSNAEKASAYTDLFSSFRLPPNPFSDAGTPSSPPHNSSLLELEIPHVSIVRVLIYNEQIEKANLGRTILQTQLEVKNFIDQDSATLNMDRLHDPFESDVRYNGCIFGLESYPPDYKHLTCSMLVDVLQGVGHFSDRFRTRILEVRADTWGCVGVGKVSRYRLQDSPAVLGNGNDTVTHE